MIDSEHRKVFNSVYENHYYVDLLETLSEDFGGPGNSFGLQDPEKICSFWNRFWYSLPDNKSIHREPFYQICDLAEGEYLHMEESGE
jgi:hypothetical protein